MDPVTRKAFEYTELLYNSVVNSSAWSTFLEKLSVEFSEASIAILHVDIGSEKIYASRHVRYETSAMVSFNEHYAGINPWAQPKLIKPNGLLVPTDELFTESDLIKTEFYHDWLRPQNLLKGFGISLGGSQPVSLLSIVRSSAAGAPTPDELRLLEPFNPHVRRAFQLREKLFTRRFSDEPLNSILDHLPVGLVAIGRDRSVLHTNRVFSKICALRDGVALGPMKTCCVGTIAEQNRFDAMVGGVLGFGRGPNSHLGGVTSATRPSGRPPYSVFVAPLQTMKFEFGAAAIALFSDPDTNKPAVHRVLGELYALTPAEIMVATKLAEGSNLRTIGGELGTSYETARSHIKAVFSKTDTRRQAELVALIARLSNSA